MTNDPYGPTDRGTAYLLRGACAAVFFIAFVRAAWVSDEAFATFRTIDNLVNGYGLRWNAAERVQAYVHPLWMFVVAACYRATGEFYVTVIALSAALTVTTLVVTSCAIRSTLATCLAWLAMACSKGFVDYSTSGLETPLTALLLAAFAAVWWRDGRGLRRLGALSALAALLLVTRLDQALLVLPALVVAFVEVRSWRAAALVGAALTPFLAWELFSVAYYGTFLPNAAIAALNAGTPFRELVRHGVLYLVDSVSLDPLTLLVIGFAIVAAWFSDRRESAPIAAGILACVAYVVVSGGGAMSGRLLVGPFLCATLILARLQRVRLPHAWLAPFLLVLAIGVSSEGFPLRGDARPRPALSPGGVEDDCSTMYETTGLLRANRLLPLPSGDDPVRAQAARRDGLRVVARRRVGLFGLAAGPRLHVVDTRGVNDPLLARLAAADGGRPNARTRTVPDGYLETLETGRNLIRDPELARAYERVAAVTRGPLWSRSRLAALVEFNLSGMGFGAVSRSSGPARQR